MKFREFLKGLLKSVKSGKIHRFLKISLIVLFLFFSYQTAVSVFNYWISVKEKISVVKKNLHWDFDWKSGELTVKADYLFVKNPRFSAEFFKPAVDVSVYESLREFRPVVKFLGFDEGRVSVAEKKRKRKKFSLKVPFLPKKFRFGRLEVLWNGGELHINRFNYDGSKVFCGGIWGKVKGRSFSVEPFSGFREGGELRIPSLVFHSRDFRVKGNLKVEGVSRWEFCGSVFSGFFVGRITVKNYGKLVLNWKGKLKGLETEGNGIFLIRQKGIEVKDVKGLIDGAEFDLRGNVSERISLKGRIKAGEFSFRGIKGRGVRLKIGAEGEIGRPVLKLSGRLEEVESPVLNLKSIYVKGSVDKVKGIIFWNSKSLGGNLLFSIRDKSAKGEVYFKSFSILNVNKVKAYRKKYRDWIPEALLTGKVGFSVRGRSVSYSGELNIGKFVFQGLEASGKVIIKGDNKEVLFNGELRGKGGGKAEGKGKIYLSERRIESFYAVDSVPAQGFRFLRTIGIFGKVSGRVGLRGELKNPEGTFKVSSPELSFRGVNLGSVEGNIWIKDFVLFAEGISERGTLEKLKVKLKGKRELLAEGYVRGVKGSEVGKFLKSFKVKLPFSFSGEGSGRFYVYSENLKEKGNLEVRVNVERFIGDFSYDGLSVGGEARGSIAYLKGDVKAQLEGKVEKAHFKGKEFAEGEFRVSYLDKVLNVEVSGVSLKESFENNISGKIAVDLRRQSIKGSGKVEGRYGKREVGEVSGRLSFSVSGFLQKFTVKFSGKLLVKPKACEEREIKVDGSLLEPENFGLISLRGKGIDLKIVANGNQFQTVGVVKELSLRGSGVRVKVNMAFVNINLNTLSGTIAVPAFRVFPSQFYPLYSVSGVYVKLENGKPEISDFSLSYVDGWVKFKEIKLEKEVEGRFEASVGLKGIVYLLKAQRFVPYARNGFYVSGTFNYGKELHYRAAVNGSGVEFRAKYLLDKAVANSLKAVISDGKVEEVGGEITVGGGNVILSGEGERFTATASLVPVGEVGKWKGLVSGKVKYGKEGVSGDLTVSKAKVFLKGKEKGKGGSSPKIPVPVNVNVLFDQPVKIKGELFSLTVVPKLWIRNIGGRVVIGGTVYITDGKINYMGKVFKVIYGTGTIYDLERNRGRISILATAYISGYYVYMKIEGRFNSLTVYLSSDPPLTREQILNLIMTGASPEEIEASSELFPAVQVAYYATASLFRPFETKFKKSLRLESFNIEPYITKYGETVAKLTVAKRLAKRIRLVGYGTTGQKPEYGGSVQLFLKKNYYLELRYNSYYGTEAGIGLEVNRK